MSFFEMQGLDALIAKFERLSGAVESTIIPNTIKQALTIGENLAKSVVPVDTGALRDSIHQEMTGNLEGQLVADAEYAGFVENGTSKMRAQPYMRPAYEEIIRSITNILENELKGFL